MMRRGARTGGVGKNQPRTNKKQPIPGPKRDDRGPPKAGSKQVPPKKPVT